MCILPQFFKDFLGYYYGTMDCAVQEPSPNKGKVEKPLYKMERQEAAQDC